VSVHLPVCLSFYLSVSPILVLYAAHLISSSAASICFSLSFWVLGLIHLFWWIQSATRRHSKSAYIRQGPCFRVRVSAIIKRCCMSFLNFYFRYLIQPLYESRFNFAHLFTFWWRKWGLWSRVTLLVWHQEVCLACKYRVLRCWHSYLTEARYKWFCIWSIWCHCHPIISCFVKSQNGSALLVPAYPCCFGKDSIKPMSVSNSSILE